MGSNYRSQTDRMNRNNKIPPSPVKALPLPNRGEYLWVYKVQGTTHYQCLLQESLEDVLIVYFEVR